MLAIIFKTKVNKVPLFINYRFIPWKHLREY